MKTFLQASQTYQKLVEITPLIKTLVKQPTSNVILHPMEKAAQGVAAQLQILLSIICL
jgi:hypothetical protein